MIQRAVLSFCALAVFALGSAAYAGAQSPDGMPGLPPQPKVHPAGIPKDAVMLSPCVFTMGEHWANPKNLPIGPIYGTYKGKPVFTEVMIDQKDFAAGKSFDETLKPLPGYKIDHVDVDFEPKGHPGYPIPHFDVHAFYVPHAVHMQFCPEGFHVAK